MANCFQKIRDLIKDDKLSNDVIKTIVDDLNEIKKASAEAETGSFSARSQAYLAKRRQISIAQQKELADNISKTRERNELFDQFKKNPAEGLRSLLGGSLKLTKGGNFSVEQRFLRRRSKHMNDLVGGLQDKDLFQMVKDGHLDKEIMMELAEFRKGGQLEISGSKEALEAAKIIRGVQKNLLADLREAGVDIGEVDGYIMRQTHDAGLLRDAGFDTWAADILPKLDAERTFGGSFKNPKAIKAFLQEAYNDIISGSNERADGGGVSDELVTVINRQKLAKTASRSRKLHFKSGEDFFEYNQNFGRAGLLEQITKSIDTTSRNSALIRVFGTDPEKAFFGDLKRLGLIKTAQVGPLKGQARQLQNLFELVRNPYNLIGQSMMARVGRNVRALANMSKLGGAAISASADWANAAAVLRAANGDSLLGAHLKLHKRFIESIPKKNRRIWARKLGLFYEDLLGDTHSKWTGGEDMQPGSMAKAQRLFFKLSLLHDQTSSAKVAIAKQFAIELGEQSSKGFDQLSSRVRANLERYGIGADQWKVLQKSVQRIDDFTLIAPDNIKDAELQTKLAAYLGDNAELGSPTPGIRERNILLQGTSEDEVLGQILRFAGQFKSFPLTMHKIFTRIALSDPNTKADSFLTAFKFDTNEMRFQGDMQGMAGLLISLTTMGYLAGALKDIANGKTPKDTNDPATWREAFIRGGSAGLYGDFLFGESHRLFETAAGPTLGQLPNIKKIFENAITGDKFAGDALKIAISNAPFQNVFYTKKALDYLLLQGVHESLNPGHLRRMRRRLRQRGQEFFAPQSLTGGF